MSVADVQALNNIADVKGDMKEITKELARVSISVKNTLLNCANSL